MWVDLANGGSVNLANVVSMEIAKAAGGVGFVVRVNGSAALILAGGPYETREQAQRALRGLLTAPARRSNRGKTTPESADQEQP